MTNAIEQTKREMYGKLACLKMYGIHHAEGLETALEAHLEDLRKAMVQINESTVACAHHSAESFLDLENRLAAMTQERDDIQLRLHAIDHAYNGSQETIGRQMDVIASLQDRLAVNAREKRAAGTYGQVFGDRGASERTDAKDSNLMAILGAVIDCQQLVSDWAIYGYGAKKQMKKMAYVLNNNPELRAALDHYERKGAPDPTDDDCAHDFAANGGCPECGARDGGKREEFILNRPNVAGC